MPSWNQWRELQDFGRLLASLDGPRILWVHRPLLLHVRNESGKPCWCCKSTNAEVQGGPAPHLDLLVSVATGARVLQRPDDPPEWHAEFGELAERATKIYQPVRCFSKQHRFILDDRHKVRGFIGGARGGKTTALGEWFVDQIYERGGPGAQFWWVAPTMAKTGVGLRKLVLGESTDRHVPPLLPPQLVRSYPKTGREAAERPVELVDGSLIWLKYGGRDGGNLKGDPAQAVASDELCEQDHVENYQICLDRLTDTRGLLGFATTPVKGHWAEEFLIPLGKTYAQADEAEAKGERVSTIIEFATAFDNPWIHPDEIEERIRAGGGRENHQVRREVFGEFVGEGPTMWPHFRVTPAGDRLCHLRAGPWWDVDGWGLVNVTTVALSSFFHGNPQVERFGGQDFNVWPMSLVLLQVGCPKGLDQADPRNWILFVLDEVVKRGTIYDFAKFLAERAAAYRKSLPSKFFAGLPISCDSTGAQFNPPASHGLTGTSSTLAQVMREHGFDCRPCHYNDKGNPVNPGKLDQVSLLHKLMQDVVEAPDGERWPRLVVHAQRCTRLVHSLTTQESDDKGRPRKESGRASDRLSGPTDALLYGAWAAFAHHDVYKPAKTVITW